MPRPATGSPRWNAKRGYWEARVTMPGKSEREPPVPMRGIAEDDEDGARRMAKLVSDRMRSGGAVLLGTGETVNEYAKRWLEAREGRIASVRDNRGHLNEHILPILGTHEIDLPPIQWTV